MMEEDFDKRLSDHIKTVFDDTDNTGADAGWLLLREKYPAQDDRKPVAWFWWVAALIVISGLGTGVWFGEQQAKKNRAKQIKVVTKPANDSALQHQKKYKHTADSLNSDPKLSVTNKTAVISTNKKQAAAVALKNAASRKAIGKNSPRKQSGIVRKLKDASVQEAGNKSSALMVTHTTESSTQSNPQKTNSADSLKANGEAAAKPEMLNAADTASKPVAKKTEAVAKLPKVDTGKKKVKVTGLPRIAYGVFASAFYSSATGSDNEFNLGAGGTVDIRIAGHLSFSSGLGIVRASLNYTIPPGTNNIYSAASSVQIPFPPVLSFHNYRAKLLALDMPLNLKYSFAKPYNYISAGLSSNVYISEDYDQVYTYTPASSGLPDQHNVTQSYFGHADLFKTLNLSFGMGYPISNRSALIFEPFLKAPFTGLGSQQLKYTLVGINLKLNFQ